MYADHSDVELVIFDCDGVLVDSEIITLRVIAQCCERVGLSLDLEEAHTLFVGGHWAVVLEEVERRLGRPLPDDFTTTFRARLGEALATEVEVIPGIPEVLAALTQTTCVASNGPHAKMEVTLGRTGLLSHFEGRIFSAYDIEIFKPEPALFLHAAKSLGFAPERCLVVEDSENGWQAAHAAGMRCVAYLPNGSDGLNTYSATVIDNMRDLGSMVQARS